MHFRKLIDLLKPRQRRSLIGLLALMCVGMVFETLSVGMVLPVLTLLTRPEALPPSLQSWFGVGNAEPNSYAIVIGVLLLAGVFLVKALILAFLAWRQTRFVYDLQADLSKRLFEAYLHRPYTFHLERNSAELIRNVVNETTLFTHTGLFAATLFATEMLVIIGVGALLLYLEPVGAVVVAASLAAAAWSFHRLTREPVLRWGNERQYHEGERIKHLQQGLGGIKDVQLLGRETTFLREYSGHNAMSARALQRQMFTTQLPRLWLELLAVAGLAILVVVAIAQGRPLASLLPLLGVFVAAAFRLIPSANRVFTTAQQMRFALPVVEVLHAELSRPSARAQSAKRSAAESDGPALPFTRELALEHVSFRYPGAAADAIEDVSLRIPRGATVGFIGGSGAGKSTLVDIVLGLLVPDSGRVTVDGIDIHTNLRGWQRDIGYVPQAIFLTDDTLRRNIAFGLPEPEIDDQRVQRALAAAQLDDFVRSLPDGDRTVVGERGVRLSGGQRQRIGIARALYHDPPVLVLDEATSSLDLKTEAGVMEAVRALHGEKTILIVAHRHSTVSHCDEIYRIERGRVVDAGKPQELLRRAVPAQASGQMGTPQP